MGSKQLSIVVKAEDQLSTPMRSMAGVVVGFGASTEKSVGTITAKLTGLKTAIVGVVTALTVGAAANAFNSTAEELEKIGDASERLGVSVETLSTLRYAAKLNNQSFEDLSAIVQSAQEKLAEFAITGAGKAAPALKLLHTPLMDAAGNLRDIGDLLPEIVGEIQRMPPAERIFAAKKIFGEDGQKVLTMGLERLKEIGAEARKLGVVFTPEQVRAAQLYRDAVDRVASAWEGLKAKVVGEVAPTLTGLLNQAASAIAAVPEMARNLQKVLGEAMFGSGEGQAVAKAKITGFFSALSDLIVVSIREVGVLAVAYGTPVVAAVITGLFAPVAAGIAYSLSDSILNGIQSVLSAPQMRGALAGMGGGALAAADGLYGVLGGARAMAAGARTEALARSVEDVRDALDGVQAAMPMSVWNESVEQVGLYADKVSTAAEALFGFRTALGHTRLELDETNKAIAQSPGPAEAMGFWRGMIDGAQQYAQEAQNVYRQGVQLATGIAGSITDNLTTAIQASIRGTKSLSEAFRTAASSILGDISQMITKMLVFRAVAGIIGAFAGGGELASGAPTGLVDGAAFANRGGLIASSGEVLHYGSGGMVPGPRINRDVVPAMLTPGEFVLNRGAVARAGVGNLHAMNSGGGGGGGGGGVVVHAVTNITIAGGGGSGGVGEDQLRAIQRSVENGVLSALAQKPQFRDAMRAGLGVRA